MSSSCTEVTPQCPVELTTLGYYPNKGLNIFFAVGFSAAAIVASYFGIRGRTWSYTGFLVAGSILELCGYIGRALMADNPWNESAFRLQIITLIFAPTLVCASIYITLKHVALALNPALSRVNPKRLPVFFVPADVSCLVIQAVGGGLAASGDSNMSLLNAGNNVIILGICLQVAVLLFFGVTAGDLWRRTRVWIHGPDSTRAARELWVEKRFRMFACAVAVAYVVVSIRCIYRYVSFFFFFVSCCQTIRPLLFCVHNTTLGTGAESRAERRVDDLANHFRNYSIAEMAGGWGNHIMQDQASFVVLDSFAMLITVSLLSCFAPTVFFPQMAVQAHTKTSRGKHADETDTELGRVKSEDTHRAMTSTS